MNDKRMLRSFLSLILCASAVLFWLNWNSPAQLRTKTDPSVDSTISLKKLTKKGNCGQELPVPSGKGVLTEEASTSSWAVGFGDEFWRREVPLEDPQTPGTNETTALHPPFNLGDVIDRVRHAMVVNPANGLPEVHAMTYNAVFDGLGVRFSPSLPAKGANTPAPAADEGAADPDRTRERESEVEAFQWPAADPASEVRIRTLSVKRDGEVFFSALRDTPERSVSGNTAQALLSANEGIIEHYEALAEGVAASWILQKPLTGAGSTEVAIAVEGMRYVGQTPAGHHFADDSGVARMRVGRAFAVDATGQRWELAVNASSDKKGLVIDLPSAIQVEATYPLAIDPIIGSEFGVDKPVSNPAASTQGDPAVAFGSGAFLVVWEDTRNSSVSGTDIYGARVSNVGKILDPLGIAISTAPNNQVDPAIAANGSTFLVVWRDTRISGDIGGDIFGARVSGSGAVLDPLGLAISVANSGQHAPSVAAGPPGFLVVWHDERTGNVTLADIYGARVTTAGIVLEANGIAICTNNTVQRNASAAAVKGGFFVAWQDDRNSLTTGTDIYGARISSAGVLMDPSSIAISTAANSQVLPAVAANASGTMVAWSDDRNSLTTGTDIYAARINTMGLVQETTGIPVVTAASSQTSVSIAANTAGFLIAWADSRNSGFTSTDIYAAVLPNLGPVQQSNGFPVCTLTNSQILPSVAATPSGFLVAWEDRRNSAITGNDIYAARVKNAGLLVDTNGFLASTASVSQSNPSVGFNGSNFLVAWQDDRNISSNGSDIIGSRISGTGRILDKAGLAISATAGAQLNPAVASSGGNFLVVWEDNRSGTTHSTDIYGARVTAAGVVSDTAGIPICVAIGTQNSPVVAGNSSAYLVAWQDDRNGNFDVFGTRVTQAGNVSTPDGSALVSDTSDQTAPAVAASSNNFLVVWQDSRNSSSDIYGTRVNDSGTVLDGNGLGISRDSSDQEMPSVAALGTGFLVVWQDARNSSATASDIYSGLVTGDGSLPSGNGFPVCTLPRSQTLPVVAANRNEYLVLWQSAAPSGNGTELASARVSSAGTLLDLYPGPLQGSGDNSAPSLATGQGDRFLAVGSAFRNNSRRLALDLLSADTALANLTVQFSADIYTFAENGKFAKVTITLTGKNPGVVTVDFATADITATAGADYMPLSGRIEFTGTRNSVTLNIALLEDTADEANETVALTLRNPTGGSSLGPRHTVTLNILDNDP